jgi:PST family polysaccharide transporter
MYIGQLVERVMFPAMARRQQEIDQLRRHFMLSLEAISLVTIPIAVLMYLFSSEIVRAAFGERWLAMVPVFSILSGGVFFRTAYKCSDTLARSVGASYSYAARQGLYTILILGGAWIGAGMFQLAGVAWGVVVALFVNYLSMTRLSRQILRVSWISILNAHLPGVVLGALIGITSWMTRDWLRESTRHPLLVLIGAGLVAVVTGSIWMYVSYHHLPSAVVREAIALVSERWRIRLRIPHSSPRFVSDSSLR